MQKEQMEELRKKVRKMGEVFKEYEPSMLDIVGVVGLLNSMLINPPKQKSNNWLKMHGYPMRRKVRRR